MGLTLLVGNLFHGLVALLWTAGLRRAAGPLSPSLWVDIHALCLVVPVAVATARLLGLPVVAEDWSLVRVGYWAEVLRAQGPAIRFSLVLLLAGTMAIFVYQEVIPAWRSRRRLLNLPSRPDPRLQVSLDRVLEGYRERCPHRRLSVVPQVRLLRTDRVIAALHGLLRPQILISEGLARQLDPGELDAVVAHEMAHLLRGGNVGELAIWLVRAVQALNPAALVLFRNFAEAQEAACDNLAARATGRPMALASALLKVYGMRSGPRGDEMTRFRRARAEISRHSERVSIKRRVRSLLDNRPMGLTSRWMLLLTAAVLGAMMWAIG